jgi:hypothetical protein
MPAERSVMGIVKAPKGDEAGRASRVLVTSGASVVAAAPVSNDGAFELRVPAGRGLVLTIIGQDRRVLRVPLTAIRGDRVDLGDLELPVAEFAPGIAGQAWDAEEERHVTGGEAILRRGGTVLARERLDADGGFHFELSEGTLLTAGGYQVAVEVPGFAPARQAVAVSSDETSYRLGRVGLTRKRRG